jgi:hypothetical protein
MWLIFSGLATLIPAFIGGELGLPRWVRWMLFAWVGMIALFVCVMLAKNPVKEYKGEVSQSREPDWFKWVGGYNHSCGGHGGTGCHH